MVKSSVVIVRLLVLKISFSLNDIQKQEVKNNLYHNDMILICLMSTKSIETKAVFTETEMNNELNIN